MSWSIKILTLYLGFVALILTLVFTCFGHKSELEFTDYYARELQFQDQLDAQQNADELTQPIEHAVMQNGVLLSFPREVLPAADGTVLLLRPSDSSKDRLITLEPDAQGRQLIAGLEKGVYKMRIEFTSKGESYFRQSVINIK